MPFPVKPKVSADQINLPEDLTSQDRPPFLGHDFPAVLSLQVAGVSCCQFGCQINRSVFVWRSCVPYHPSATSQEKGQAISACPVGFYHSLCRLARIKACPRRS